MPCVAAALKWKIKSGTSNSNGSSQPEEVSLIKLHVSRFVGVGVLQCCPVFQ